MIFMSFTGPRPNDKWMKNYKLAQHMRSQSHLIGSGGLKMTVFDSYFVSMSIWKVIIQVFYF